MPLWMNNVQVCCSQIPWLLLLMSPCECNRRSWTRASAKCENTEAIWALVAVRFTFRHLADTFIQKDLQVTRTMSDWGLGVLLKYTAQHTRRPTDHLDHGLQLSHSSLSIYAHNNVSSNHRYVIRFSLVILFKTASRFQLQHLFSSAVASQPGVLGSTPGSDSHLCGVNMLSRCQHGFSPGAPPTAQKSCS